METNVITINASGLTPRSVAVAMGTKLTIVNDDTTAHDMNSNPHPEHTQCPELNVGSIRPGESRESQTLQVARTCGIHDHEQPTNTSLQATIVIR